MAYNDYINIEFGVGIENGNQLDTLYKISVDESVKEALHQMKEAFDNQYMAFTDPPTQFELAEKYATTEHLYYPLVQNELPDLFNLFSNSAAIPLNAINIERDLGNITYYFAIFSHRNRTKTIGVKRPAQFKGLLQKKVLIYRIINDSLEVVPDDLFKLDNDFDFFINQNILDILHPNGFLYISKIDQQTLAAAALATNALSQRIHFINFAHMAPLVETNKTAARLISSIKGRLDLEHTSEQLLLAKCRLHNININQVNGLLAPDDAQLVPFLQILDRRIYDYELIDNQPEHYLAASRNRRI